ncbi:PadR family transcriptional regulator [Nocardia sp. NBC_00511]|uniref:PadR family transcriptional regulator n=1 Tax=Nocardia sp. NBC_00511 TaxID=2903591 RepID=UPI0030E541DB
MNPRRFAELGGFGPGSGRFFGPGELRWALMALIAESPGHGYELMSRLEQRCGGSYRPSAGAVYPTLQQLDDEGLAILEIEGGRKVFHISPAGRTEVDEHGTEIAAIWARADQRGEWGMFRDPDATEIIAPAMRLFKAAISAIAHSHGDPAVIDEVRAILTATTHKLQQLKMDAKRQHRRRRSRHSE